MRSRLLAASFLPTLAFALALPVVAHAADRDGVEGRATSIQVNASTSDVYLLYHGRLFVQSGKNTTEYRWGGTSCGSRILSAEMVALLYDLVRKGDNPIKPIYQDGQASTKCLVGFTVKEKKDPKKGK